MYIILYIYIKIQDVQMKENIQYLSFWVCLVFT